jgi:hypothetical protein
MYSITPGCPRHDERGASRFMCVCYVGPVPCLACDENAARGQAASGLATFPAVAS